jgi:hypothetical protein
MLQLNSAAKLATLLGVVGLTIVFYILVCVQDGGRKLTILDKRFHVSKFVVSKGPTYTIYPQGKLKSRAREQLLKWGLPVGQPAKCVLGILPRSRAFFVHYSLDSFPPSAAVNALEAELVDGKGVVIPLRWFAGGTLSSPETYYSGWSTDVAPTTTNDCVFRLKLKTNSTPVAEVVINKL